MITYLTDLIFVFIFYSAFYAKAFLFADFKLQVQSYRILPTIGIPFVAYTLLLIEFTLSVTFAGGYAAHYKDGIVIVILIAFIFLGFRKKAFLQTQSCSCFGSLQWLNANPLLRNVLLLSIAGIKLGLPVRIGSVGEGFVVFFSTASVVFFIDMKMLYGKWKGFKLPI